MRVVIAVFITLSFLSFFIFLLVFVRPNHRVVRDLRKLLPAKTSLARPLCQLCDYRSNIFNIIIHLNDRHNCSRETIAKYISYYGLDLTLNSPKKLGD